jgi:hypothetical protein
MLSAMSVGDVNRDARPDLVVAGSTPPNGDYVLQVFIGAGDGTFTPGARVLPEGYVNPIIRIADLNRDGKPDIAVLNPDDGFNPIDALRIWFGDGAGGVTDPPAVLVFAATSPESLHIDDVNRDGFVDAVMTGHSGIHIAFGSAAGLQAPIHTPSSGSTSALADINGDGALDVVMAGGTLLHGDGDGNFTDAGVFDYEAAKVRVADFTRDGLSDIVYVTALGVVAVLVNERNESTGCRS